MKKMAWLVAMMLAGCTAAAPPVQVPGTEISFRSVDSAQAGVPVTLELPGPTPGPEGITLPAVDGLTVNGSGSDPNQTPPVCTFFITATRAGDFTIPAFDVHSADGKNYHVLAFTLHVAGG